MGLFVKHPGEKNRKQEQLLWAQHKDSKQEDGVLHIAKIPYETGELHFMYSQKLSPDGTKWVRDGRFAEYYQNGNLASEGFYADGLEDGYWKDYHENGMLAAEGFYSKGSETGTWKYYNEQGVLEEEETYDL